MMKVRNPRVEGDLVLAPSARNPDSKVLVHQLLFIWTANGYLERVLIPAGFQCDGASVPRWVRILVWMLRPLRKLLDPWGFAALAAVFHDYCFHARPHLSDKRRIGRKQADLVFLAFMRMTAKGRFRKAMLWSAEQVAWVMFLAVRLFGEDVWDKHDSEFRQQPEN